MLISFTCPNEECGELIEDRIGGADYDWNDNDGSADAIGHSEEFIYCGKCDSKYLLKVKADRHYKQITLAEHDEVGVDFNDDTDDFYYRYLDQLTFTKYYLDPLETFTASLHDIDMFRPSGFNDNNKIDTFNKIAFLHYYIAFEAYLNGKIAQTTLDNYSLVEKMFEKYIKEKKKKLIKILKGNEKRNEQNKEVKEYLHRKSFQSGDIINDHYLTALNLEPLLDGEEVEQFDHYSKLRHHIVHRNGFDKNATRVHIRYENLDGLKQFAIRIVRRIEHEFAAHLKRKAAQEDDDNCF